MPGRKREVGVKVDPGTTWKVADSRNIVHDGDGLYSYIGAGDESEEDIGTFRTARPLDPAGGTFEVKIVNTGERNCIAVGVCHQGYPPGTLPGWKETSVAFHTDEGSLFHSSDDPEALNLPCQPGDSIRFSLFLQPDDPKSVLLRLYRNGTPIAQVPTTVPAGGFYGIVGMMSKGEQVLLQPLMLAQVVDFERLWTVCTPHRIAHEGWGRCSYVGPDDATQQNVGTVRMKVKVDPSTPADNCLKVQIAQAGAHGCIAIGVCSGSYPTELLPGWDEPSVGYHADTGQVFKNNDEGHPTGQICQTGDTVTCTVEPVDGSMKEVGVIFHRNGTQVARSNIWSPAEGFYFCVGMMNPDEKVSILLPEVLSPYISQRLSFPDVWQVPSPDIEHRGQGVCHYTGAGGFNSVRTVRSKQPLDPSINSRNTFEVKIVSPGELCCIAVGVCSSKYGANLMPGWEESSVGYHADDGCVHQGVTAEHRTSHLCRAGDVMRCTVEPQYGSAKEVAILFYKNGSLVNKVIQWSPSGGYYALVGMMSKGEVVQIASPLTEPSTLQPEVRLPDPARVPPPQHPQLFLPTLDQTGPGGMSPQPSQRFRHAGYHGGHAASFSGVLPMHHGPQGSMSFCQEEYPPHYTQEHRIYQGQEYPSYHPQEHPGYQDNTREYHPHRGHSPYHYQSHFPYHAQGQPLSYHTQVHSPFYPPTVPSDVVSLPSNAGPMEPHYSTLAYGGDPRYSRSPYTQSHGMYEEQSGAPHPSREDFGEFDNARRTMSSPLLATKVPSYDEALQHASVTPRPYATYLSTDTLPSEEHVDGEIGGVDPKVGGSQTEVRADLKDRLLGEKGGLTAEESDIAAKKGFLPAEGVDTAESVDAMAATALIKEKLPEESHSTKKGDLAKEKDSARKGTGGGVEVNSSSAPSACGFQRLLSVSALPDIPPLPKASNKTFQFLHNVVMHDSGELQCSSSGAGDIGYIMCRQPLNEKLSYYELEIVHMVEGGLAQVGLVWNGFPARKLPGTLQGSLAYNSCTGTLHTGAASCRQVSTPCAVGDIIGCKAHLRYKQEVVRKGDRENDDPETVKVEFFRNGSLLGVENVSLPPSGLFPAIGLVGQGVRVKFSCRINLTPETYFLSHPLPAGFVNYISPPSVNQLWSCLQNAVVSDDGLVSQALPHPGVSTVIQGNIPFSVSHFYCELHLKIPLKKFTVLSVGVLPKVSTPIKDAVMMIGNSENSVGFFPLLGVLMKNEDICSAIPDFITSDIKASTSALHVGFGIHFNATPSPSTAEVFFTIAQQQLSSIVVTLPPNGLYPTFVFDTDCKSDEQALAKIDFPFLWPQVENLPYGFVRGSSSVVAAKRSIMHNKSSSKDQVSVLQAGFPLSRVHSYYEVVVRDVMGDAPQIAIGLASHRHPLNVLPGLGKESIAFHAHDGAVYEPNTGRETVAPGNCNAWLKLGCGARFCTDGSTRCAEVFFTVHRAIVCRKLVQIPHLGLFPTIGLKDFTGTLELNPFALDPFPDLVFSTHWKTLENIQISGTLVCAKVHTKLGLAQLASPASSEVSYFTISLPQPVNRSTGKVFIGFSNSNNPPFGGKQMLTHRSCFLDVVSGTIVWCTPHLQSDDIGSTSNGRLLGCGIWRLDGATTLLFFTMDGQVIYCTPWDGMGSAMFPTVCLIDCQIRVTVDACAGWPPASRIGRGWGRTSNLALVNSEICHAQPVQAATAKSAVGFAQAAVPLIPGRPYFEVEITSLDAKRVAVGVASKDYPVNSWVGMQDNSLAYSSDTGKVYSSSSTGKDFGPRLTKGDTVGCGVVFTTSDYSLNQKGQSVEVYFTVNGAIVGRKKVTVPHGGFFPTVCLDSSACVLPTFHSKFPPTVGFVGRDWSVAYSVCQVGQLMCHRGGTHTASGGIPRAFCQAATRLSSENPYFEVEVVNSSTMSTISVGVGIHQGAQATTMDHDLLLYNSSGDIVTKSSGQKITRMAQKYFAGDVIGCSVTYGPQVSVDFYRNGTRVATEMLPEGPLKTQPLFPLIALSRPGDAAIPRLYLPPPQWDSSALFGWLRTERVSIRNNVVEYIGPQGDHTEVGVAQMSQPLGRPGIAYYELEVLDTGAACSIGIGAASATYPLTRQPGWHKESIGYHGDDGRVFRASGSGDSFGPVWKKQDVVGLGIRSASADVKPGSEVQVYFTMNGQELGHLTVDVPTTGLFPTIGLHSKGEKVKVSIGTSGCCSNSGPGRLAWRALCGVSLHRDSGGLPVLEYRPRQAKVPSAKYRLGVAIAQQPLSSTLQYFEVHLRRMGKLRAIAIGVVHRNYSLEMATGWGSNSIGYHTDNGYLYHESGNGQVFGPIPSVDSTIGCGVIVVPNSTKHCFVYFTYNGIEIGRVRAAIPDGGFYPSVTLTSLGDKVSVRFLETFKPKFSEGERQMVGLLRIVNCSYSSQLLNYTGSSGTDPAIAQFAVALHRECNYYCANVVNLKDTVVFGLATWDFSVKDIPGRSSVSVAYDITGGQIDAVFNVDNVFQFRAPKCSQGDTVGCGVEASESKTSQGYVYFTRNGMIVQKIELNYIVDDLYPIVGIRSIENCSTLFMVWSDVHLPAPNKF